MTLQERLDKKSMNDLVFFIDSNINKENIKIIEHREIITNYRETLCILPYKLSYSAFDNMPIRVSDIIYTVKFSYHIIKKGIFGKYESADISVIDNITFQNKADADLYMEYAKYPSICCNDNKYLNEVLDFIGLRTAYVNILSFNNVNDEDFISIMSTDDKKYYFVCICNNFVTPSLSVLFEYCGMLKNKTPENQSIQQIKHDISPKLEFIIRDEIERTETYLKTLKQIM